MSIPVRLECFTDIPRKPEMVVVSGASGAGKGTIVCKVLEFANKAGEHMTLSRSWTSRDQRPNEPDDAYNFVSRDEFEQMIRAGGFLEFTEYNGNYYGTPLPNEDTGQLIVEIETNGAYELKSLTATTPLLAQFQYVLAANPSRLEAQLFGRNDGLDNDEKNTRLGIFYMVELEKARGLGAHVIINTDPNLAALKSYAALSGVYFCDPTLAEVVRLYNEEKERYFCDRQVDTI